jgi:hypothetical protein
VSDSDGKVLHLVRDGYIPVPAAEIEYAEKMIADLRAGLLTGFMLVAVGPESAGERVGFTGSRMDRLHLLGCLMMAVRRVEDAEIESRD